MIDLRSALRALLLLSLAACASSPQRPASVAPAESPRAAPAAVDQEAVREILRHAVGLRPSLQGCMEAARGGGAATRACVDAELQHQEQRLAAAVDARRAKATRGDVDAVQAQWQLERDRLCGNDEPSAADMQRIRAGICRAEATAARADALAR